MSNETPRNTDGSNENPRILNKSAAANYLGISRRTLHNWLNKGHGPEFTVPPTGRAYTTRDRCDQFLASNG